MARPFGARARETVLSAQPIPGEGDLSRIILASPEGDTAEVYLHGAHVTSWVPAGGREALFVSRRSAFSGGTAIRGGVPVIFPQFGELGPLPRHGFARTSHWSPGASDAPEGDKVALATLTLSDDARTRAIWPHAFRSEFGARVSNRSLHLRLAVTNTGKTALSFTAALHTYLRVTDVRQSAVWGLRGTRLIDKVQKEAERSDHAREVRIDGPLNRVYLDAPRRLHVNDGAGNRGFEIAIGGFRDVVLWNPWVEGATALADMADDEYLVMLCVEAAQATPVTLSPGESWIGRQSLLCKASGAAVPAGWARWSGARPLPK